MVAVGCSQESHAHRLTPQDADGDKKGIGSVPDPFGTGAYTASDKALRGKSGLVHETKMQGLCLNIKFLEIELVISMEMCLRCNQIGSSGLSGSFYQGQSGFVLDILICLTQIQIIW